MQHRALDIIQAVKRNGIGIVLNNGQLQLKTPKDMVIDPALLEDIRNHKQLLIDYLGNNSLKTIKIDDTYSIHPVPRKEQEMIRLSFAQERLWFIHRLQGSVQYHLPYVFRLRGELDTVALEKSFRNILQRHEVLRSVIREKEGVGYQLITGAEGWQMQQVDLTQTMAHGDGLKEYIHQLVSTPFDLENDPMLKVWLLQVPGGEHVLIALLHHIAFDGLSINVLVEELAEYYTAYRNNRPPVLQELPIQYADYAVWQRNRLSGEALRSHVDYWKQQLTGVATLDLPFDHTGLAADLNGANCSRMVDKKLLAALQHLSQQEGTTLFMTLLAVFNVLLHKYCNQDDICVGSPIAGRRQQEVEGLIGFFINTLVLRNRVNGAMPFNEVLQQVKRNTLNAYEHQDLPFEKIVEVLGIERDVHRNPLYNVLFTVKDKLDSVQLDIGGVRFVEERSGDLSTQFEINFNAILLPEGLQLNVVYNTSLYDTTTIERMLLHYEHLLQAVVEDAHKRIAQLDLLGQEEKQQLLYGFNNTAVAYEPTHVLALFNEQVQNHPSLPAVVFENKSLSYAQLDERSSRLASYLIEAGVKSGLLVPICLDRSPDMIVSILGVLKAGGAYVPVDPSYPLERIHFIVKDTEASVVLTNRTIAASLSTEARCICVEEDWAQIAASPVLATSLVVEDDQLAYVIYTSGSTGTPKGVMIEHRSLTNYILNASAQYGDAGRGTFFHLPFSFDASVTSLFVPLVCGSAIVMDSEQGTEVFNGDVFAAHAPYDFIKLTPSHLALLEEPMERFGTMVKNLVVGGEALQPAHFRFLSEGKKEITIINEYGPTEATVGCCTYSFNTSEQEWRTGGNGILIGRPMGNVRLYIVDEACQPVPIGVYGELCIAGVQLAKGYLNQPALTKEKFIEAPFMAGERMYRTGDICRWQTDGQIEYVGRRDDQVKIRGYRIELGEVETVLAQSPGIRQSVVLVNEDSTGNKRLVAYTVPDAGYDKEMLLQHLQDRLPAYMIPSLLIEVESIPLTSNGKTDRKALQQIGDESLHNRKHEAPRNGTEQKLAAIWQDLLEIETIGRDDDFFSLGGHSLLAIRLISYIKKELDTELSIKDIFDHATISKQAVLLSEQNNHQPVARIERMDDHAFAPLSFAQERLWFIDKLQGSVQYHMPWVFRLRGSLDVMALQASFKAILQRHEVLRTVIKEEEGIGYQSVNNGNDWQLTMLDVNDIPAAHTIEDYIRMLVRQPFDLREDAMLKVWLIKTAADEYRLVTLLHHIAFDGWSIGIMVDELSAFYKSAIGQCSFQPNELPVQYRDFAAWQRQHLSGELLETKLAYWKNKLHGVQPLELVTDKVRPAAQSTKGSIVRTVIEKELVHQLQALSQEEGVTLFMTLLAAFNVLMHKYTGQSDICVGSPIAGRQQPEVEGLIGFFVNTLALRNEVSDTVPFSELLRQVKQTTLEAYEHQEVPFEKIIEVLDVERDRSRTAIFQVMFALQNMPESAQLQLGDLHIAEQSSGIVNAKFDLGFTLNESEQGLQLTVIYCTDLFEESTAASFLRHYEQLLRVIVKDKDNTIGALSVIDASEKERLLREFSNLVPNRTSSPFSLQAAFDQQLMTGGTNTAIRYKDRAVSYASLQLQTGQIGWYLRKRLLLNKGDKVVVLLNRSEKLVVTALALLRSGLVYVPVDSSYPEARISYLIKDVAPSLIITDQDAAGLYGSDFNCITIGEILGSSGENYFEPELPNASDDAYIIYTSGSTGAPKGVVVSHGNLNHLFEHISQAYLDERKITLTFTASHAFDISLLQLYTPLLSGGTVLVVDRDQLQDLAQLVSILQRATVIDTVPGLYKLIIAYIEEHELASEFAHIERVFVGGDKIPDDLLDQLATIFPQATVTVLYGPTEATLFCTHLPYHPGSIDRFSRGTIIGRPFNRTQLYILGKSMELLPAGVEGEICIGGPGVSKGYLHQEELTAQKYAPDTFSGDGFIYRTGDVGRWTAEGLLEFRGRNDNQVKIRGNRVELGELENKMKDLGEVEEAVVVISKRGEAEVYLFAFYTGVEISREKLEAHLGAFFSDSVLPSRYIHIDAIPLTDNQKVDRKALQQLAGDAMDDLREYTAPRNETERMLCAIWQEMLKREQVSIHDNFFELGGHSLLAIRMIAAIRKRLGYELHIRDFFSHPTVARQAVRLSLQDNHLLPAIPSYEGDGPLPLSFAQERLWFIDKLQGSIQYHLPMVFRIKGNLDIAALESSFREIVQRHSVLRTVIKEADGAGYQRITQASDWSLQQLDGRAKTAQELEQYVGELVSTPFDLAKDPMLKLWLLPVAEGEYVLVLLLHHIAADAWSMNILVAELRELYIGKTTGRQPALKELPVQYADYAVWQRKYLSGDTLDKKLGYWKEKLSGVLPLELPTDRARPSVQTIRGGVVGASLEKELIGRLKDLSQQAEATLFMTLLSAFQVLLYKYTGQQDVCVGSPIAGRQQQEVEGLIGFFVNTLALRNRVQDDLSFVELLHQVKQTTLEAFEHQDVPFEKIVEVSGVQRDMSRTPVFQVLFSLQNVPQEEEITWGDLVVETEKNAQSTAQFEINLNITPHEGAWQVSIVYNKDLFEEATMERMLGHYENVLRAIVADKNSSIGSLDLLGDAEVTQLLHGFNDTAQPYPSDQTLVDLFEAQAARTPEAIAIVFDDQSLTYAELSQRSTLLVHYLKTKGVVPGGFAALCLERSADLLVCIFAVWKAGAAYLPLDPSHPELRLRYMIEDSGAGVALCHSRYSGLFQDTARLTALIVIDDATTQEQIAQQEETELVSKALPQQLSYLIYTSGSTGRPKGVQIRHRSLVNFLCSMQDRIGIKEGNRTIAVTTYSFDISCLELYAALLVGGTVHLASSAQVKDGYALKALVEQVQPAYMQATPSGWRLLLESGWRNEEGLTVLTGGEAISEELKETLTALSSAPVYNLYGPTETTIWSTMHRLQRGEPVSIGRPIANTGIYILSPSLQLCPIGVYGELCIGGDGVAEGYLNRGELTGEKFIETSYAPGRIYRTGDAARWNRDGTIEYRGRKDEQVKVRGYRIELGEIETVLSGARGVAQAVVVAVSDTGGSRQLIAYLVTTSDYDKADVFSHLRAHLPDYMVPGMLSEIEAIPLTPNGKIDRKTLQSMEVQMSGLAYQAARNDVEEALVAIWEELLGRAPIGVRDNFFETGGHSLLAMRMVSLIRKRLDREVAIREVFLYPTIELLALQLGEAGEQGIEAIQRYERGEKVPLSFSQERLWFIDRLQGSVQYHMPYVFRLKGALDVTALEASFRQILGRHEVLRTVIREEEGVGYQLVLPEEQWAIQYIDEKNVLNSYASVNDYIASQLVMPFDLSIDPMLKVWLIRITDEEYLFVTLLHHIAFDGWSIGIMVNELVELYQSHVAQRKPVLKELPVQYADYAIWQRKYLSGDTLNKKLSYWKEQLAGVAVLELPTDRARPAVQDINGAVATHTLGKNLIDGLNSLSQRNGVTLYMTLLSAFDVLLHKYSGQSDICVGSPAAGRVQQEVEGLIGFFINTLALRSQLDGRMTFTELLQQVKQTTLDAYEHQDVPFERIVEALDVPRDLSRTPVFQVMFVLQNMPLSAGLSFSGVHLHAENTGMVSAKFDLTLTVTESSDGAQLNVAYSTSLYDASTIERMLLHYEHLLQAVAEDAHKRIARLDLLGQGEKQQLLYGFNDTAVVYEATHVLTLFSEQVQNHPALPAVVFENESLTYAQLDERSSRLAFYLIEAGVKSGSLVPICLDRSLNMIVSILGVLKAGGAYVPVDPSYPLERIHFIVKDTEASVVLTNRTIASSLSTEAQSICVEEDWAQIAASPALETAPVMDDQLAYVIYTSGSTGTPKGVMIGHRSLTNYILNASAQYGSAGKGTFFHLPFSFDASVTSLFVPLVCGSAIVMDSEQGTEVFNGDVFSAHAPYDFIKLTPSHLALLEEPMDRFGTMVKKLVVGGEALKPAHFRFLSEDKKEVTIINEYGPTEATVGCCTYSFNTSKQEWRTGGNGILIGRPMGNVRLYIVDETYHPVPIGVYGELCIAGVQLAKGYLNQPALTKEKFIEAPFMSGERMYRTGDICRWQSDGQIEYAGRSDDQVKIRGYRIELGEVENALQQTGGVKEAVVLVQEDQGHKRLTAYIVASHSLDHEDLREQLRQRLPAYMVPSLLVEVTSIPLTPNGKADRQKLLAIATSQPSDKTYIAPRNEVEQTLAAVWQELLGVERVGIDDNFFELGGDSIITIQVVSRLKRKGYELQPKDLFMHQSIARLSALIVQRGAAAGRAQGEQGLLQGRSGLLPIQQWYFENAPADVSHFNQSVLLGIDKAISPEAITVVIRVLAEQHDALRFRYTHDGQQWLQEYGTHLPTLQVEAIKEGSLSLKEQIKQRSDHYQRSLDIEKGELMQVVLFQTPKEEPRNRLLLIIHHLAVDGVTWRILLEDMEALLTQQQEGQPLSLGVKGSSYRQWQEGLQAYGRSRALTTQKSYWTNIVAHYQPLKTDKEYTGPVTQKEMGSCSAVLSREATRQLLQQVPKVYHTEAGDLLLAALARTLSAYTETKDLVIGLEGHGREDTGLAADISGTAGWFTTMYPVLFQTEGLESPDAWVKSIKEQLRRLPDKGLGYGVLKYIVKEESLQGAQPWEIMFNYLGQTGNAVSSPWLALAEESTGNSISDTWRQANKMEVISIVEDDRLQVRWKYSTQHYDRTTIEELAHGYIAQLETLIGHCLERSATGTVHTPSDFGLAEEISYQELDAFLAKKDTDLDEVMSF